MIELNLLPEGLRGVQKKKSMPQIRLPNIKIMPVVITVTSIFIFSHLGISLIAILQKNSLIKLSSQLEALAPKETTATGLKKESDRLSSRLSVIDSLTGSTLIWSKKLYDLSEAMIDGVWLTSLTLNTEMPEYTTTPSMAPAAAAAPAAGAAATRTPQAPAMPTDREVMLLEGSAVSFTPGEETAVVGKFIKSLKEHNGFFSDFEDIKLRSINRRKLGSIDIMDFTLVCYFKTGRSYFEKLEAKDI